MKTQTGSYPPKTLSPVDSAAAQARLAAIVETSEDAILSKSLDGTILTWNAAAERMFGYRPEEIIGKPVTLLLPPERLLEEEQVLQRLRQGESIRHFETVRLAKGGQRIEVSLTVSPVKDADGKLIGASKILRDITERKQAEEELNRQSEELQAQSEELARQNEELERQSEELQTQAEELQATNQELNEREAMLQVILDSLHGASDERQMLSRICEALVQLAGSAAVAAAVVEQVDAQLVVRAHAGVATLRRERWPLANSFASLVMAQGRTAFVDDLAARPDLIVPEPQERAFRSLLATPLRVYGKFVGAVELYSLGPRQWTRQEFRIVEWAAAQCALALEQKRAEETLARLAAVVESSDDAILSKDLDGTIRSWNAGARRIFGYQPEEIIGRPIGVLLPADRQEEESHIMARLQAGERLEHFETVRLAKGGRPIEVSVTISALRDGLGEIIGASKIIRDITARKLKEAELRQLNRTLLALRKSSQAMLQATSEAQYLDEVCKIVVETCGYAMIWVGYAEQDEHRTVRPVAYSGFEAGYLESLGITWADTPRGRGPTGTAIRTGQLYSCRNILEDPRLEPWRAEALKRGYASSIALPLLAGGKAFGAVTLYSSQLDPFSEAEQKLLSDLANDLAYGIQAIRLRDAKAETEKQLQLLSTAVESAANGIVITDRNGQILWVNPAFSRLTGYSRAEALGQNPRILKSGQHPPEFYRQMWVTILRGEPWQGDMINRHKDGSLYAEEMTITPVLADGAGITHFVAIKQDVTRRKHAERRTELLAETASRLLSSREPQRVVDELCQKVLDFLGCQVFFNYLVYEPQERLHLNACAGIPKTEAERIEWLDYGVAVCGCVARDGCRIVAGNIQDTPDERAELVRSYGIQAYACHPLMVAGRLLGTLSFGTRTRKEFSEEDLSLMKAVADLVAIAMERKRSREALQRSAEELQRSNRDLEQFAYVASHDLQEPLRAVGGYAKLLQRRFPESLDAKAKEWIAGAVDGANRMERLITDLLAFSRVGSRGGEFLPADLNAILDEALLNLQASLKASQTRITREPLPALTADATQMMQLFQNLIGNAMKFRSERPLEIHVGVQKQPDRWVVSVGDNGIGIEPQYFERIFQIFQRLHTRKQYPGTGIGLAICKKIVERHGGSIWVESKPGEGSTFYFSLPLDPSGIMRAGSVRS